MQEFWKKRLKKDRLALEMTMVGFAGVLEDTMEKIIKPDTLEEKISALNELALALDTIADMYHSIEETEERLKEYVSKKETLTDVDRINREREESTASLLADAEEVQV